MTRQTLRPDQKALVDRVIDAARRGKRRILVRAPTGFGKTTVMASLVERVVGKGKSAWVVVHRKELADQAAERIANQGINVGIMMGERTENVEAPVLVVGVQTIAARLRPAPEGRSRPPLPPRPAVAFIDECHHAVAPFWRTVFDHLDGSLRIGLSATPWAPGGGPLGIFDEFIDGPTVDALVGAGQLSRPVFYCGKAPDLSGVRVTKSGDFDRTQLESRTTVVLGDVVDTWKKRAAGMRTIAFACSIDHSKTIVEKFTAAGIPAAHVDAETPADERRQTFARLRSGDLLVVSNVSIVSEGFDAPAVECAILARPTASDAMFLQMVGRALRPFPGKDKAVILDHGYNVLRHGSPLRPRPVSIEEGLKREHRRVKEEAIVEDGFFFRLCAHCGMANDLTAQQCASCGGRIIRGRQPKEKRGELELVDLDSLDMASQLVVRGERYRDFCRMEVAMMRSGKSAWAATYAYKAKYGKAPHDDGILDTEVLRSRYWAMRRRGRAG